MSNIICRVCGNAGHFARDCVERQKGTDWRQKGPVDAVDTEYEVNRPFHNLYNDRVLNGG